jgi:hypothetical protein
LIGTDGGGGASDGAAPRKGSRLLRRAILLYPAPWRRRYGDEFGALLDETPFTLRALFDVAVSAVDAHVNPTAPMRRWPFMFERLRASELAVFAGWVVFVVSGFGFAKMTENWGQLTPTSGESPTVWLAYYAVVVGAVIALAGVLVAGVPIAWAIARSASRARRWRLLGLFLVPPVSLAVWVALTLLLVNLAAPGSQVGGGLTRVATFAAWVGVFGLAALASTVAVTVAAINGEVAPELYRRAVAPATIVAAAMAAVVVAVALWGAAVLATEPSLFWGNYGMLASSTALSWLGVLIGMAAGAAVALRGAAVARAARFA